MEEGQEGVEVPLGDITGKVRVVVDELWMETDIEWQYGVFQHDVDAKADDESFDVDKEKESTKRSNKSKNPDVKVSDHFSNCLGHISVPFRERSLRFSNLADTPRC